MVAKFCRHCGANITHEGKFCGNCGQLLSAAPTTQEARNTHQASVSSLFPITPETKLKFCKNCGRKVTLNGQLCARCGADLSRVGSDFKEEPEVAHALDDQTGEQRVTGVDASRQPNAKWCTRCNRMVEPARSRAAVPVFAVVGLFLLFIMAVSGMLILPGLIPILIIYYVIGRKKCPLCGGTSFK